MDKIYTCRLLMSVRTVYTPKGNLHVTPDDLQASLLGLLLLTLITELFFRIYSFLYNACRPTCIRATSVSGVVRSYRGLPLLTVDSL